MKRLAVGGGVEPPSSSSKPDVLPVTPSRIESNSGHWDSNPEPCADLALKPLIRRLLYLLSYAVELVAVEGVEPTSLDYQSSALAVELHRDVVDPTGLKPAPHGLKGRRSVTRAPGQDIADFRLSICPRSTIQSSRISIGNWQSEIGN